VNALVVLPEPPVAEGGASGRCALALLKGLAGHGVDVSALAARQHWAAAGDPPSWAPVTVVDVPPEPRTTANRIESLRRPVASLARDGFGDRVREAAAGADVLHLEEVATAACSDGVRTPALVHLHYLVHRDRPFVPPWKPEFRRVLEFVRAERAAVRRHRWLVASSPFVADELRGLTRRAEVVHAPLSLDLAAYPAAPLDGPPVAGLIGSAAWPPTAAAIRRLLADLWPLILRLAPDAHLRIAGRGTDALVGRVPDGVEILGAVPSAGEFLRGLSVLVYPLDRGSGMKVKVLESVASGLPVVTTPAGAEGIEAGEGIVVETEASALARAAASVLLDGAERRERGAAARAAFELRYSPAPATEPLVDLYRRMAGA
jgi:glycosyltransferase involved in cell wall biosynthesis